MNTQLVLDHGYIQVIETWGSDERIVEAARMSTAKGFLGWGPKGLECPSTKGGNACAWRGSESETAARSTSLGQEYRACPRCGEPGLRQIQGDEKLLRYLYENNHATPFEMAGMIIEVQAPIFVFREWHRHRTQSYNELSARYTPLPSTCYVASVERAVGGMPEQVAHPQNKQAGTVAGAETLTPSVATALLDEERALLDKIEDLYQRKLKAGFPKEIARTHTSVSRYSRMRASANLRNWLAFMTLRSDKNPGAQWEIRQYANALGGFIGEAFPRTYALFDGRA